MGLKDLKGPLLIDSLDHPNPQPQQQTQVIKKSNKDHTTLVIILLALIPLLFGSFLVVHFTEDTNIIMYFVKQLFFISIPVASIIFLVGTCVYVVVWLQGWASKNRLVSISEGPWQEADIKLNQDILLALLSQHYDVQRKRAEHSIYQGVSTLTLDQSSSNSTSTNASAAATTDKPQNDTIDGYTFDLRGLQFLDYINKGKQ